MDSEGRARVVIAGGGVAALEAALALRALAADRVTVELVAPEPRFWYRPLAVAEPFNLGKTLHFDLPELASAAGAVFSPGAIVSVDAGAHVAETSAGAHVPYDVLLLACGSVPKPAIPGALTFRGPADVELFRRVLAEIGMGDARSVAFAVPWGSVWSLPIYELALMTATLPAARDARGVELALVTPEDQPLQLFGGAASAAMRDTLEARGVTLHTRSYAEEQLAGELRLFPDGAVPADRTVALPRLYGQRIDGVPQTVHGFVPVDAHGRVVGLPDVFAAGDITSFPIKQGGLAAQQAEAAAEAIAADLGVDLTARAFRPVLRGLLLTGGRPQYLRRDLAGGAGDALELSEEPLWWPPAKIVGRYVGPFLAAQAGVDVSSEPIPPRDAITVDVDLRSYRPESSFPFVQEQESSSRTIAEVMSGAPLVVAPEDTLGEVSEKMRERDTGSAVVASFGEVVGILTSRDLLRAFAGRVHPSEGRVREWMTAEPVVATTDTSLEAAALLMTENGIHHLPVVDNRRPVGMVGLREVARAARARGLRGVGLGF